MKNKTIKIYKYVSCGRVIGVKINRDGVLEDMVSMHNSSGQMTNSLRLQEIVEYDQYKVCLRLDFSDLDKDGNPSLDADFYDKNNQKISIIKNTAFYDSHHTPAQKGTKLYHFEFDNKKIILEIIEIAAVNTIACSINLEKPNDSN